MHPFELLARHINHVFHRSNMQEEKIKDNCTSNRHSSEVYIRVFLFKSACSFFRKPFTISVVFCNISRAKAQKWCCFDAKAKTLNAQRIGFTQNWTLNGMLSNVFSGDIGANKKRGHMSPSPLFTLVRLTCRAHRVADKNLELSFISFKPQSIQCPISLISMCLEEEVLTKSTGVR